MTQENFESTVKALAARLPFHPFTIKLIGGRRLEVDHSLGLAYSARTAVFISPGGAPIFFDHDGVVAVTADTADASA